MCGIYGAVVLLPGKKWSLGIIRALTWANRERGTDSLGFFDSSGRMMKGASDPAKALQKTGFKKWLKKSQEKTWFIAGHTRFATYGIVNRRNSHPFRYGRIIGSHNGMVTCPKKFRVDSEYLIWALNKGWSDYQKSLEEIAGYFGLSWFDGKHFYLLNNNAELAYTIVDGVFYYSSDWTHLESCTGGESETFHEGQVIRIDPKGNIANSNVIKSEIKPFIHKAPDHWSSIGYSGRYSNNHVTGANYTADTSDWLKDAHDYQGGNISQYDETWHDAWTEYCEQNSGDDKSIHSLSDDDFSAKYAG